MPNDLHCTWCSPAASCSPTHWLSHASSATPSPTSLPASSSNSSSGTSLFLSIGQELDFHPPSRSSQIDRMVSGQRQPIRSMATTTRISPETSLALRARQPARLLVPVPPETATSR